MLDSFFVKSLAILLRMAHLKGGNVPIPGTWFRRAMSLYISNFTEKNHDYRYRFKSRVTLRP